MCTGVVMIAASLSSREIHELAVNYLSATWTNTWVTELPTILPIYDKFCWNFFIVAELLLYKYIKYSYYKNCTVTFNHVCVWLVRQLQQCRSNYCFNIIISSSNELYSVGRRLYWVRDIAARCPLTLSNLYARRQLL